MNQSLKSLDIVLARIALMFLAAGAVSAVPPAPLLWRDPGRVETLDFRLGPGGSEFVPQPPFRFLREMRSGTSPKVEIRDARNRTWRIKFGSEARPDVFSSRMAWACGYYADPIHFIAKGRIEGATGLERAGSKIDPDGTFHDAAFETTPATLHYLEHQSWDWNANPFTGSRS